MQLVDLDKELAGFANLQKADLPILPLTRQFWSLNLYKRFLFSFTLGEVSRFEPKVNEVFRFEF